MTAVAAPPPLNRRNEDAMSEAQPETQPDETPDAQPDETPDETPTPDEGDDEEAHGDDEQTPDETPDETPEAQVPQHALGEREIERMMKRIDSANTAYRKRVAEIMGAEVEVLEPCPRCADPVYGAIFPPMMKPVDAETKARVLLSVGEEGDEVTRADPYARRCDTCDGAGYTLTGSRLARARTIKCHDCGGRGWLAVGPERTADAARAVTVPPSAEVAAMENGHDEAPAPAPDTDLWGRGKNDPNYGVHPMYVNG